MRMNGRRMNGRRWAQMISAALQAMRRPSRDRALSRGRTPLGWPRPLPRALGRACGSRRRARFGASAADRLIDVWCRHVTRRVGEGTAGQQRTERPESRWRGQASAEGTARRGEVADTPRKKLTLQSKARTDLAAQSENGTVEGIKKKTPENGPGRLHPLTTGGHIDVRPGMQVASCRVATF